MTNEKIKREKIRNAKTKSEKHDIKKLEQDCYKRKQEDQKM